MSHPTARHGRQTTPKPFALIARCTALAMAVVVASGTAVAGYGAWSVASDVKTVELASSAVGTSSGSGAAATPPEAGVTTGADSSTSADSPVDSVPPTGTEAGGATAEPQAESGQVTAPPTNSEFKPLSGTGTGTATATNPPPGSPSSDARTPGVAIDGGVDLLLVGSDSREGQGTAYGDTAGNLADVTTLLHIPSDHSSATVVSFPRDLVIPIPECPDPDGGSFDAMSAQPLNVTLTYGGLPCTVLAVEQLTGIRIPYAAELQFTGVIELSNAVGGVPVCVVDPIDDDYTGVQLDAGTHTLKGADALGFLRTRHSVGDGSDMARISSQQVFLSALVRSMNTSETLGDISKLYGLARAAASNMVLSTSLASPDTMVSIGLALKDIDPAEVTFVTYPGSRGGDGVYAGKVQPISADADVLFQALAADRPVAVSQPGNVGAGAAAAPAIPDDSGLAGTGAATSGAPISGAPTSGATDTNAKPGSAVTVLPESITGQTAAEHTCSKGNDSTD